MHTVEELSYNAAFKDLYLSQDPRLKSDIIIR